MAEYETILVETRGRVGLITLNRREALNALSRQVMHDVTAAAAAFDADDGVGAIVLTGSEKAFAAGADIKEMKDASYQDMYAEDRFAGWDALTRTRKPIIAAVSGFALGGGCELAMMCDIVVCGEGARFGQPEINLGIMPGMGGTQRLTKAVGKSKAMEMILTGRMIKAEEAERSGLVARVFPDDALVDEAVKIGETIASKSLPIVMMAKETVNRAEETTLGEGLRFERRLFHAMFATADQKEGMEAFVDKRDPDFTHG